MKKYLGIKTVLALAMCLGFAKEKHGVRLSDSNTYGDDAEGYLVEYQDGYKSWSPKSVFDAAYRSVSGLTFGDAVEALKAGNAVARQGWNGKGMFLSLSCNGNREVSAENFWSPHNAQFARQNGGKATVLPSITMKTATGEILMGWLASQTDMLADDWMIVEHEKPDATEELSPHATVNS